MLPSVQLSDSSPSSGEGARNADGLSVPGGAITGKILGLLLPCLSARSLFCAECVCRQWRALVSSQLLRLALAIPLSNRNDFGDTVRHVLNDEIGSAWRSSCLLARRMRALVCDRGLVVSASTADCTFSIVNTAVSPARPLGPDGFSGALVRTCYSALRAPCTKRKGGR
jgi:hypothetical protein